MTAFPIAAPVVSPAGDPPARTTPRGSVTAAGVTLSRVWAETIGQPLHSAGTMGALWSAPWTAHTLGQVLGLAVHAQREQTGAAQVKASVGMTPERALVALAQDLVGTSTMLLRAGMSPRETLGWLTVAAAAPGPRDWFTATALLTQPDLGMDSLSAWRRVLAVELAPLAFAAGLSCATAIEQVQAGRLTAVTARAMATKRGYRLPAVTGPATGGPGADGERTRARLRFLGVAASRATASDERPEDLPAAEPDPLPLLP